MSFLSALCVYLFLGTLAFLYVVKTLKLKELKQKPEAEAINHARLFLNGKPDISVSLAFSLILLFFPAMIIAELFYDWE